MDVIRSFGQISKKDTLSAGGKGASLGEMTQAGFPVPPGFVILAGTFDRFINEAGLSPEIDAALHSVRREEMHTIEHASERIQNLILSAPIPPEVASDITSGFRNLGAKYVAVRSSATVEDGVFAAWAGQLDSYLNTDENELLQNVQRCWASLFTPRAIFYRFEKDLHTRKISVAVVVQKMIESDASGIAFSVHPVTEDPNQLIIEAGWGLGEAVVGGHVTPDSYIVEKMPLRILDSTINTQNRGLYRAARGGNEWKDIREPQASCAVLNAEQVLKLASLVISIENHYGFPCDIEWAYEHGTFYIVQSRPITTLRREIKKHVTLEKIHTREHSLFYISVWNKGNFEYLAEYSDANIRNLLFLKKDESNKVSVWYNLKELEQYSNSISHKAVTEEEYLDRVIASYHERGDKILPYLKRERKIESISELEDFHRNWAEWWSPFAVVFILIDSEGVPDAMRKKALAARAETQEYSDVADDVFIEFFTARYPQYSHVAYVITPEEVFSLEKGDLEPSKLKTIERRLKGYILLNGELHDPFDLPRILEQKGIRLVQADTRTNVLKGTPACPGKASGYVRKIVLKRDLVDVKEGEILVTEMTSPESVPAMKKSAAIITDEGGVTSHAAIASRELGKPCVIGTKIATEILNTGDFVEVDADEGIVRIVKKTYKSSGYHFAFQTNGVNLLFSDLCAHFYSDFNSVVFSFNNEYRYYIRNGDMDEAKNLYRIFYTSVESVRDHSRSFERAHANLLDLKETLGKKTEVAAQDFEYFVSQAATLLDAYSKFDPILTDYLAADTRPDKEALIREVLDKKNLSRELFNEIFFHTDSCFLLLLKKIAARFDSSIEDISSLTIEQVRALLTTKETDSLGYTNPDYAIIRENDSFIYLLGEKARDFVGAFLADDVSSKKDGLQGISVSLGGKWKGFVQKVSVDYSKFKESIAALDGIGDGMVIVTESTVPEMVPLLARSIAIITDTGGLLSHAAITARELNKPCIIGTKTATKYLKDGDFVEVDADKGIARLL